MFKTIHLSLAAVCLISANWQIWVGGSSQMVHWLIYNLIYKGRLTFQQILVPFRVEVCTDLCMAEEDRLIRPGAWPPHWLFSGCAGATSQTLKLNYCNRRKIIAQK